MLQLVLLIVAVCGAMGDDPTHYNIDQRVDELLPLVNNYVKNLGLSNVTLPDMSTKGAVIFIGVSLTDCSTLLRTGVAEMWQSGENALSVKVNLGLTSKSVNVVSCPFMGAGFSWDVGALSVEAGFTLLPSGGSACSTRWDYFNITQIDDIVVHTPNPDYDGKAPPAVLQSLIIPQYNYWLNTRPILDMVEQSVDLCGPLQS